MPYKRYMHNAVAALLLLSAAVYGEISIVNLKGMTSSVASPDTGVKKEFEEISPAVGALVWHCPFLKNVYIYAPDDTVTRLVKELFYLHADGTFDVTRMHTKLGLYLDPEGIGTIIGTILLCRQEQSPSACFMAKWHENIMPALIARKNTQQRFLESQLVLISKEKQELMKSQKILSRTMKKKIADSNIEALAVAHKLIDDATRRLEMLSETASTLNKTLEHSAEFMGNHAQQQSTVISELIARLLDEEQRDIRPAGITASILLGLLWQRTTSLDDLRVYLDAVAKTLSIHRKSFIYGQQ